MAKDLPRGARFLLRATERLHAYGTPAHRLERVVTEFAAGFGLSVQVFSTPTSIILGIEDAEENETVHLLRVDPGGVDLGRLVELDELMDAVTAGTVTPDEAFARLDEYEHESTSRSRVPLMLAAHVLATSTAAVFFGGGPADAVAAGAVGAVIGVLEQVASRQQGVATLFEPIAAFLAAVVATLAASFSKGHIDEAVVALAAVIVLVPGLSLTVAFVELATRHLASGTARLMGSMTVFLTIAFGTLLGRFFTRRVLDVPPPDPEVTRTAHEAAAWMSSAPAIGVTLVLAAIGFAILFRVRRTEVPWVVASAVFGFTVARLVRALTGVGGPSTVESAAMSAFAGALAIGLFSNAYARLRSRPSTVPLVPGILVLVPGSVGYRALSAFSQENALSGLDDAFQMLMLASALVGGMLAANVVLPPRRIL